MYLCLCFLCIVICMHCFHSSNIFIVYNSVICTKSVIQYFNFIMVILDFKYIIIIVRCPIGLDFFNGIIFFSLK